MGFTSNGSYKVLSPLSSSWDPSSQQKPLESPAPNARSKQQKVVELVKKWLLCGGWMFDSSPDYDPVISPGKTRSSTSPRQSSAADGYVKPPKWKQFLRRVRARSRKVQNACCEGLCFHPHKQPLNYCSTDSYERNFDRGREYWEDQNNSGLLLSSKSAPGAVFSGLHHHHSHSATPILWENRSIDSFLVSVSRLDSEPIWQQQQQPPPREPIAVAAR